MTVACRIKKITVFAIGLVLFICIVSDLTIVSARESRRKRKKSGRSKSGLKSLIQFSKDRNAMVKEYNMETKNYDRIREAVDQGYLDKGESASRIKSRYGEPVIILPDTKENITKWVYKPASATYFSDEKVYLIFDENDEFVEWKVPLLGIQAD